MEPTNPTTPSRPALVEEPMKRQISCGDCGAVAEEDEPAVDVPPTCNACGSANCTAVIIATTVFTIRDRVEGWHLTPNRRSKKKAAEHFILGAEIRRSTGEFVEKIRHIDRENDHYFEKVTDEAGVVLHHVDEPLSEHWGHGSAKFKKEKRKGAP